jgi:hypothetical protein
MNGNFSESPLFVTLLSREQRLTRGAGNVICLKVFGLTLDANAQLTGERPADHLPKSKRPGLNNIGTMYSSMLLGGRGFERGRFLKAALAALILVGAVGATRAAVVKATGQISGVSLGRGEYAYTLTLQNTAASTADIGMFWFAWEAGEADFLLSEPTSIVTPSGWTATVDGGGAGDGYSVQFVTFTTPLAPGSSATFTFNSSDSPKLLAGPAPLYPQYPTLTSQVYSGHAADGVQDVFVVQVVSPSAGSVNAQLTGQNLVLTWPAATNVVLQQASSLSPTNWTSVAGTLGASSFTVTNVSTQTASFYRLATQ